MRFLTLLVLVLTLIPVGANSTARAGEDTNNARAEGALLSNDSDGPSVTGEGGGDPTDFCMGIRDEQETLANQDNVPGEYGIKLSGDAAASPCRRF
jgi:hypothetical protein